MQVTLDIPQEQLDRLDDLQKNRGGSREQLVSEALAAYLPPPKKHLLEYFGVLKGRVEDGMAFQDRMRREWDRVE